MMKKKYLLIPLLTVGLLATSCSNSGLPNIVNPDDTDIDTPWEEYDIPVESLTFDNEHFNVVLNVGQSHTYDYTYAPSNATPENLKWNIADAGIASLTKGADGKYKVTGVAVGTTTVTVSGGEDAKFAPITLNVRVDLPMTDFTVEQSSVTLDYLSHETLLLTYTPENNTQKEMMSFVSSDESVATVNSEGVIHSHEKEGTAIISVTHPYLNKRVDVTVTVVDQYKYLTKFDVKSNKAEIDLDETAELSVEALPVDASCDLSTVIYETSTPEIISVEGNVVTALAEGEGKVNAKIGQRGGVKVSDEITIKVNEIKATALSLGIDSGANIQLDNRNNSTYQIIYKFATDRLGVSEPSRKDVKFISEPEGIVTISEEGLVTAFDQGTAKVTVKDLYSGLEDSMYFTVTLRSKSVVISGASLAYIDESITLTASTVPAVITDNTISWEIVEGLGYINLVADENKATITANEPGTYKVAATNDGITSVPFEVKFEERPVYFEYGNGYIVGSRSYVTGVSEYVENGSWNEAKYAYKMHDRYDIVENAQVIGFGYKSTVEFATGDEWKIRMNENDWKDIDSFNESGEQLGRYKIDEGAFIKGQMEVKTDDDGNRDILVTAPGKYDIVYSQYTNTANGWYEVYVVESGLKVDADKVNVQLGNTVSIKVSDWGNNFSIDMLDKTIATENHDNDGNITIIPVAVGQTTLVLQDEEKTIEVLVTVSEEPVEFVEGHYYLVGNADFSSGASRDGESWNDVLQAFEFVTPVEDESLKAQYKAVINFSAGEEFKIRKGTSYPDVYAEQKDAIPGKIYREAEDYFSNFRIKEGGEYELYLKIGFDDGMSLYAKKVPTLSLDKVDVTIQEDKVESVFASNAQGALVAESSSMTVVTVVVTENQIILTAHNEGVAIVRVSDGKTYVDVYVIVTKEEVKKDITIYFAGVEGWTDMNQVNVALDGDWKVMNTTTGLGQYKYTFETTTAASKLNFFFTNTQNQYRHPSSGDIDWNTDYSEIKLGAVTLEPGYSYVITFTDWHYHWDNWEHAWFNYTFVRA